MISVLKDWQLLYLRWLKARSQCEPSASLPLDLSPLLWPRALSPIKAWASSASSPCPQTNWALCSASWSPAALNSLWSCHRFTSLKMFPEPAFLLLLSASRHSGEGPATMEGGEGACPVSIRREARMGGIHLLYSVEETERLSAFVHQGCKNRLCHDT